ncbi:hypothetical protein F4823DRAFT_596906 [Ustulina deusta]|nr:hypothetical protein F4823DRAFT_596906 [Ustulina deusta]
MIMIETTHERVNEFGTSSGSKEKHLAIVLWLPKIFLFFSFSSFIGLVMAWLHGTFWRLFPLRAPIPSAFVLLGRVYGVFGSVAFTSAWQDCKKKGYLQA